MNLYKFKYHLENYKPNEVVYFMQSDSEVLFKKNNKISNDSIKYYIENPIEYKLNNEKFRTPDNFNTNDEGNVYLGCSHTFGIGHHLENVWSYKLNKTIGGKFWNLGIGGTGVISHYRILKGYYKELKIKNIFHFAPKYPRFEFIINHKPFSFNIGVDKVEYLEGSLFNNSFCNNDQIEFTYNSYIDSIKCLANEIGANYYLLSDNDMIGETNIPKIEARDLQHYNTIYHHNLYRNFLEMFNKNNN
jgi:hypothetical protein